MDVVALSASVTACAESSSDDFIALITEIFAAASPAVDVTVHNHPSRRALTFIQGSSGLTLLHTPADKHYSPVIDRLSDHHFAGFSAAEVAALWMLSYRVWEKVWMDATQSDLILIRHMALGGKTSNVPGKAPSTSKNRLAELRKEVGVQTNAALVAHYLRSSLLT